MFAIKAEVTDPSTEAFTFSEQKSFSDRSDGRPETEINFKFYRQATNKIVGISAEATAFLRGFF